MFCRAVIKGCHLSRPSSLDVTGVASHHCTSYSQLTRKLLQVYIHRLRVIKNLMTALLYGWRRCYWWKYIFPWPVTYRSEREIERRQSLLDQLITKYVLGLKKFSVTLKKLSVFMLCLPRNRWQPFLYHIEMMDFEYFRPPPVFSWKNWHKLRKVYWIWQVGAVR